MRTVGLIFAGLLIAAGAMAERKQQEIELQAAIRQETVDGDLRGAIKRYGAIVAKYARSDRAVAAMALVHMAECHQKLGDAESRKLYEQIVKEYGDQKQAVVLARARLGRESAASRGLAFRQIWKLPSKADIFGKISRDGRYLPYVEWDQNGDLYLHDFSTALNRRLTDTAAIRVPGKTTEFAEEYCISRDNKQVVYSWWNGAHRRYELRVVDLRGDEISHPRLLFDNEEIDWIAPDDWSPDGKSLAVRLSRADTSRQIGVLSLADGGLRILKSVDWRGARRLFFSPDGKYLGYDLAQNDNSHQRDVFVLAVDGSREIPAVVHRANDTMMGWSPDGAKLLFASNRTGSIDLWSLPFADGQFRGEPELIKADVGRAESLGFASSGALYFNLQSGVPQTTKIHIARLDLATGTLISAPTEVTQEIFESARLAVWSPDGKYLAYVSNRGHAGSPNEILIIHSAEGGPSVREIRLTLTNIYTHRWAPDSRSLILQGRDLKGRWGIYKMDVQSGEVSLLVLDQNRQLWYPVWSPDGKSLYCSRRLPTGNEQLLVQKDLESGSEKELLRRPFLAPNQISPDGRYLAVSSVDLPSLSRVNLLIPIGGGEPREVMRVAAGVGASDLTNYGKGVALVGAQWAPDSRSFLTMKWAGEGTSRYRDIWRVSLDGSSPTKLDVKLGPGDSYQLHPDGRRIVFTTTEKGSPPGQEVWVLENFLPPTTTARR